MEKLTWPKNAENLTFFKELDFKIFQGKMPSHIPPPSPHKRPPQAVRFSKICFCTFYQFQLSVI